MNYPEKFPAAGWRRVRVGEVAKDGDILDHAAWDAHGSLPRTCRLSSRYSGKKVEKSWTPLYRKKGPQ